MVAQVDRRDGGSGGGGVSDEIPLVWYDGKGERKVIGTAKVDRIDETGIHIKGEITPGEFAEKFKDPSRSFSFTPVGFFEY